MCAAILLIDSIFLSVTLYPSLFKMDKLKYKHVNEKLLYTYVSFILCCLASYPFFALLSFSVGGKQVWWVADLWFTDVTVGVVSCRFVVHWRYSRCGELQICGSLTLQ